jgi:CHAD domain-containing protein
MAPAAHKAEPVEVPREASVRVLARAAVHSAREQMRRNTRGARSAVQPDYVHQLRVGARRARVIIKLFGELVEPAQERVLERDLRWIFRTLGELRDRDVLLGRVHEFVGAAETVPLWMELTRQRARAARTVTRALGSKRYQRIMRALGQLERQLQQPGEASEPARKWAKKRLKKRLRAVLSLRDAVTGPDEDKRHQLRKELKKLRYTAELVRGLWRPKRAKRYLDGLSDLQDALGTLNDVATGARLLDGAARRLDKVGSEQRATVQRELERLARVQLDQLEPAFLAFEHKKPFWK